MKITWRGLFASLVFVVIFLVQPFALSAKTEAPSATEAVINHYREIVKTATDPAKQADAHFEIGRALEKLDRKTEATAEYLKIIVNYPDITEINEKAEERLAFLYTGFAERAEKIAKFEPSSEEKDPTIFFAYIKGLYENYRNRGQYDKALQILEKLYDMDSENAAYIVDIGNIYLRGYNDPNKAIVHFEKAIKLDPSNTKAYIDLGAAYEKKEDYESAVGIYQEAAELFPASPWAIYGLKRTEVLRLAQNKNLIKDWYITGPFDNSDKKGLDKAFPPEEKIDLAARYRGKNGASARWTRPFNYEDSGYVDLNSLITPNDYSVAYAVTFAHSPNKRKVKFLIGSDRGIRIWVNNTEVFKKDAERQAEADEDSITVDLKKGWNKILVKVTETWGSWGFYFRVTDLNGNRPADLIFDPTKNETRLKEMYGLIAKKKRLRITGIALLYVGAFSIFFLGLYFMISNIQNRIKINRMKEDFISSVSHELKTPIAAIKTLTEVLKGGKVKKEVPKNEYCDMIIKESDRLTRFINKILDFSKLESGGEIFRFTETDVADLVKKAIEIYKAETRDEKLKISLDIKNDKITAEIDTDAITQVILNLLDNAYKYSVEKKEIKVTLGTADEKVFIEVMDYGLGIPKDDIKKIFDKFYRVDRGIVARKGTGLGLAFSQGVVNAHCGNIVVESKPGKGSKFTIALPVRRA